MKIDPDLVRKVIQECYTYKERVSLLEVENKLLRMDSSADNTDAVDVVHILHSQIQELIILNNKHISQVNSLLELNDTYVQKLNKQCNDIELLQKDVQRLSREISVMKAGQATQNQLLLYTCSKIQLDTMKGFIDRHYSKKKRDVHSFHEEYLLYMYDIIAPSCRSKLHNLLFKEYYHKNIYKLLSAVIGEQSEFEVIHNSLTWDELCRCERYPRRDWRVSCEFKLNKFLDDVSIKINNECQFHFIKFLQQNLDIINDDISNEVLRNIYRKSTS